MIYEESTIPEIFRLERLMEIMFYIHPVPPYLPYIALPELCIRSLTVPTYASPLSYMKICKQASFASRIFASLYTPSH